jgi:hypothetical protein
MKRLELSSGRLSLSTSSKKVYEEIFNGDPTHMQVLREFFLADGEIGARKQRRRSATRAYRPPCQRRKFGLIFVQYTLSSLYTRRTHFFCSSLII